MCILCGAPGWKEYKQMLINDVNMLQTVLIMSGRYERRDADRNRERERESSSRWMVIHAQ